MHFAPQFHHIGGFRHCRRVDPSSPERAFAATTFNSKIKRR
jgi:hypothetical protein